MPREMVEPPFRLIDLWHLGDVGGTQKDVYLELEVDLPHLCNTLHPTFGCLVETLSISTQKIPYPLLISDPPRPSRFAVLVYDPLPLYLICPPPVDEHIKIT
jgi:hypothetical protein